MDNHTHLIDTKTSWPIIENKQKLAAGLKNLLEALPIIPLEDGDPDFERIMSLLPLTQGQMEQLLNAQVGYEKAVFEQGSDCLLFVDAPFNEYRQLTGPDEKEFLSALEEREAPAAPFLRVFISPQGTAKEFAQDFLHTQYLPGEQTQEAYYRIEYGYNPKKGKSYAHLQVELLSRKLQVEELSVQIALHYIIEEDGEVEVSLYLNDVLVVPINNNPEIYYNNNAHRLIMLYRVKNDKSEDVDLTFTLKNLPFEKILKNISAGIPDPDMESEDLYFNVRLYPALPIEVIEES